MMLKKPKFQHILAFFLTWYHIRVYGSFFPGVEVQTSYKHS